MGWLHGFLGFFGWGLVRGGEGGLYRGSVVGDGGGGDMF